MNDISTLLPDLKLRFNIEHPSFEECYAYGYECALEEVSEEDNPYPLNSKESEQWLEGWWAGLYGEQPLYELGDYVSKSTMTDIPAAANDHSYHESFGNLMTKIIEITGVLAATAFVGYQMIDLVA